MPLFTPEVILGLFNTFAPIVRDIVWRYQQEHDGALPTDKDMQQMFVLNINRILAEGATWKAGHPEPPEDS